MKFIEENGFYLYSIIFIIFTIRGLAKVNSLKKAKFNISAIILGLLDIVWFIIGLYLPEKNLFIALIIFTYIIPLLYGIYNRISIDKNKLENNFKEEVEGISEKVINSKDGKKFTIFIFIMQLTIALLILVSHYRIAIFYLFNN